MSLSICLITRDAEQKMQAVLNSIANLGAEVIVIDTGSTDGTVQAAQALGAKVSVIAWQNDFAHAQNQALAQATGDWIFWLNPDEELLPNQQNLLRALLGRPEVLGYVVRVQEIMQPDQTFRATETLSLRLFRRQPDIQYIGRLHPHFIVPIEELAGQQNKQIVLTDLTLHHHAYLSELTPDKLRWASRLLELELRDRPGQLHYLIEYGRHLLRLNDSKGHRILAEAAEQVLAASTSPLAPTPTVASLLEYLLTVSAEQSCSRLLPAQARELALRWFAKSPPLLWRLAQRAFEQEHFQEAIELLERLITLGLSQTYDRSAGFDPSLMGDLALLNLGNCHLRLGNLDRAEGYFGQLLTSKTQGLQARTKYALVQQLRARQSPSSSA